MNIFSNKSVILPAFTGTNPLDSATISVQRCYTAAEKFMFRMPAKRFSSIDWILCVRFRFGLTVRRYKLWSFPASLIYMPTVDEYAGEVIYPEFCLEAWSLPGVTPILSADLELLTTIGYSGECSQRTDLEPADAILTERPWNTNIL